MPYATDWMGETGFAAAPLAAYGFVLLATSRAFKRLQVSFLLVNSSETALARTLNRDWKIRLSLLGYALTIVASFWQAWAAGALYILVALSWLVPDRCLEPTLIDNLMTTDKPT